MTASQTLLQSSMQSRVSWLLLCLSVLTALVLPFVPFPSLSQLPSSLSPPPTPSSSPSSTTPLSNVSYVILIDAGSSGTRVHVHPYTIPPSTSPLSPPPLPLISPSFSLKVKPGLSSFPSPSDAAASLLPLLHFASSHIPPHLHPHTPLYLYATAGLRTLPLPTAEALLHHCRTLLSTYPFHTPPSHVRIISGVQEGINGWIAANYLLSHFASPPSSPPSSTPISTVGVLEMGGASFQLTYAPLTPAAFPSSTLIPLTIGPHSFLVYTQSYLHYGLEKAQELYATLHHHTLNTSDPCYPAGLHDHPRPPRGNYQHCVQLIDHLIRYDQHRSPPPSPPHTIPQPQLPSQQDEWEHPTGVAGGSSSTPPTSLEDTAHHEAGHVVDCALHSCSFAGQFIPPIAASEQFLAIENFYYTSEFFQLLPQPSSTSPPSPSSLPSSPSSDPPSTTTTPPSSPMSSFLDLAAMRGKGEEFCQLSWEEINRRYPSEPVEDLAKYCFSAAYLPRVLEVGLGMVGVGKEELEVGEGSTTLTVETEGRGEREVRKGAEEGGGGGLRGGVLENVRITKHIDGVAIDWALGAVLLEITNHLHADVYAGTVRAPVESHLHGDAHHH